jgi:hypothetical protein
MDFRDIAVSSGVLCGYTTIHPTIQRQNLRRFSSKRKQGQGKSGNWKVTSKIISQ